MRINVKIILMRILISNKKFYNIVNVTSSTIKSFIINKCKK